MAAAVAAAVPPPAAYETNPLSCVLLFAHKLFSARGFFGVVGKTVIDDGLLVRRVAAVSAPRPALPQQQGTLTLKLLWGRSAPNPLFHTVPVQPVEFWQMGCVKRAPEFFSHS